jgi:hypothetical protein
LRTPETPRGPCPDPAGFLFILQAAGVDPDDDAPVDSPIGGQEEQALANAILQGLILP